MELEDVQKLLYEKAKYVSTLFPETRWYLFGSILDRTRIANDIDILVLYNNPQEPQTIRAFLEEMSYRLPLHILFMTEQEEAETQFLNRQLNHPLFPVSEMSSS